MHLLSRNIFRDNCHVLFSYILADLEKINKRRKRNDSAWYTCGLMLEIRTLSHLQITEIDCGFLHQVASLMVTSRLSLAQPQFCIDRQLEFPHACLSGMHLRTLSECVVAKQKSVL